MIDIKKKLIIILQAIDYLSMSLIDHSNYRTVNEASIHKNVSFFMVRVIFENIPGLQMILKKRGCCMQGNRRGSGGVGGGGDGGW